MKVTTLILTAVAALGFSALQAKASIGTTVYYSHLSCSIVVDTNKAEVNLGGSVFHEGSAHANIGNKQLLDLFAMWVGADRTSAPWKTAKLVIGWDWSGNVLVVDQTGTNVLFDATEGVSNGSFTVDFFDEFGTGDWTEKDAAPGFYNVTDTDAADWDLFDDEGSIPYTSLWGNGSNTQNYHVAWNASDVDTNWSDSENAVFGWTGDQYFDDIGSDTSTKAEFSASGSGKGGIGIGWAD
jgi:hypothetical protein